MKLLKIPSDVLIALAASLAISIFLRELDFLDRFHEVTRAHENWELDEFLGAIIAFLAAGTILAISRNIRLQKAMRDLKEAQETLQKIEREKSQQEKIISMGQLSGGLAHEINNALQPVLGLSDIIKLQAPDQRSLIYDCARMINDNAKHMRSIVQKVMQFTRGDVEGVEPYLVPNIFEDALSFTTHLMPSTLKFSVSYLDDAQQQLASAQVNINRTNFIQVLTNVLANAAYAMHNEGEILIKIKVAHSTEKQPISTLKPGAYVCITVEDFGTGMDEQTSARAFEPFYTTKPEGEGTGLGLSTSYGIIHQWNGTILLESTLNVGTKVALYIPVQGLEKIAA